MTIDDVYKELSSLEKNSKQLQFYNELGGFTWGVVETYDYLNFPTLSLSGIGQVHLPIFKEVMKKNPKCYLNDNHLCIYCFHA